MNRMQLHHIAWSKFVGSRAALDLADSSIAPPDLAALGLPHAAALPAGGLAAIHELGRALGARLGAPAGRVLVTAGASEANAVVFGALLDPGDEVLVEQPSYEPHIEVPKLFGATVRRFSRSPATGFGGWLGSVEEGLRPSTRLVVLSDLHNPTGAALDTRELDGLGRLAESRGFQVLVDETFRDASRAPLATASARGARWVTTSSLTKCYGLGGLRIGWVAARDDVLERCAAVQDGLSVQPSHLSAALALALVPHLDALRARTHRILERNHATWRAFLERVARSLERAGIAFDPGIAPGGTTAWCTFERNGLGDLFAKIALEQHGTSVTPGRFFGDPRGFRTGVGVDSEQLEAGLERLERAAATLVSTLASAGAPA